MALRGREEIANKIAELKESSKTQGRNVKSLILVFSAILIVFGIGPCIAWGFTNQNEMEFVFMLVSIITVTAVFFLCPIFYYKYEKGWRIREERRKLIADSLTEIILNYYDEPDAENKIIARLDALIVSRYQSKPSFFYMLFVKFIAGGVVPQTKLQTFKRLDAAVQAYTWVISPGVNLAAKEE